MKKYSINKKSKRSKLKIVISALVLIFIIVGLAGWYSANNWYNDALGPVATEQTNQQFVVESGETVDQIGMRLEQAGLIKNKRAFSWYVSRNGNPSLQVGVYRLSPHLSVQEIVAVFTDGKVDTFFNTIAPGLRLDQVEAALVADGFDKGEVKAALNKKYDHPLFEDVPSDATLEGYIFPETIQLTSQTTVEELLTRHFDAFYGNLSSELIVDIKKQGLSLHEAVILASIIQREISDPEVQPAIARVFLNRLERGMTLGADATFIYAAAILGVEPAIDIDSPYNTRINAGLTPGPIANFNFSALEAVAQPDDSDYLYFVSGDDGNTYFATTEAEHIENTNNHCFELCKL